MYLFLIIISILACTNSQMIEPGKCPTNIAVQNNFNMEEYAGVWYEILRYNITNKENTECTTTTYNINGTSLEIINTGIKDDGKIDKKTTLATNTNGGGKFNISISDAWNTLFTYWVLETDYKSYSLIYSCRPNDTLRNVYTWILSRTPVLKVNDIIRINEYFKRFPSNVSGLSWENYHQIDHCTNRCKSSGYSISSTSGLIFICVILSKFYSLM